MGLYFDDVGHDSTYYPSDMVPGRRKTACFVSSVEEQMEAITSLLAPHVLGRRRNGTTPRNQIPSRSSHVGMS